MVTESSDSSLDKILAANVATAKDKINEPTLQVVEGVPLAVSVEVPIEIEVESSEERIETASPSFPSSE